MNKYGSRKFGLTVGIVLLATGLVIGKLLSGSLWVTVIIAALGLYKFANVQEKKNDSGT